MKVQQQEADKEKKEDLAPEANPKNSSEELIVNGHIQSFIDFFLVTHNRLDEYFQPLLPEELTQFQNNLISAEQASKAEDINKSVKQYAQLGNYFQEKQEQKSTQYFYERCLEIAKASRSAEHEAEANQLLGQSMKIKGDIVAAVHFYETALNIVQRNSSKSQQQKKIIKNISSELMDIYTKLADKKEKEGDIETALEYH